MRLGPYHALGVRFELRCPRFLGTVLRPALVDLAERTSSDAPCPTQGATDADLSTLRVRRSGLGRYTVRWNGELEAKHFDAASALAQTLISVNHRCSESASDTDTVLHAGVLEIDGVAVAVVGYSGAGKTTLTAAGVLAGHGFIADEICAIAPDRHVRPFHRPLGLRRRASELIGLPAPADALYDVVNPRAASEIGTLSPGAPLGAVVLLQRRSDGADPGRTEIERMRPVDALVQLANQTLGDEGREREAFHRLDHLVREVPVFELRYDDIAGALTALREISSITDDSISAER